MRDEGRPVLLRSSRLIPIVLLALSATALRAVASAPLSLSEYRAHLLEARSVARAAMREKRLAPNWAAETQSRIAAALPPPQAPVRLPTGSVVKVDNRALLRALSEVVDASAGRGDRGVVGGMRRARPWIRAPVSGRPPFPSLTSLGLLRFAGAVDRILAATAAPVSVLDRARTDRALQSVLSRPEYQTREPQPSWFDHFISWLARLLERWFPQSAPAVSHGDRLARLMVIGVVLLLAVLIARIILLVLPSLRLSRRREEPETSVGELLIPREPEALLAEAERAAAAGRYREALRLAYLAMVVRLDRAGVLPEDRSRTHWELLRELRRAGRDSLYQELAPISRRLDERLYGGRTATAEDYQLCRGAHDQIERLLCAPA